jgi:hypothetical protein
VTSRQLNNRFPELPTPLPAAACRRLSLTIRVGPAGACDADLIEPGIPSLRPYRLARGCDETKPANGSPTAPVL